MPRVRMGGFGRFRLVTGVLTLGKDRGFLLPSHFAPGASTD